MLMNKPTFLAALSILKQEYPKWKAPVVTFMAENHATPFRILISTVLSLRTKDEVTALASKRLFKVARTPKSMAKLPIPQIEKLIYPVGFYRNKAKQIQKICEEIQHKHAGLVPDSLETLLEFKGVGRKTANLVLSKGFNKPAICVDTHVHRITNRLGFIDTQTPDETELALMKKLPKEHWQTINELLVAFGQTICRPIGPKCPLCKVNKCPSRRNQFIK
jgi:endonuclease-3